MKTHFVFKRTNQLSEAEKTQFLELKSAVSPTAMTMTQFDHKYLHTQFGYSYHGLMIAGDAIVGTYNAIPFYYTYFGKRVKFCLSVDTMIHAQHRSNPFGLLKTANVVADAMKQDGICFIFGFPNDNAYEYTHRVLQWKDIGELDIYVLPRSLGGFMPKLRCFNMISRAFAHLLVALPSRRQQAACAFGVEKIPDDVFTKWRYDSSYQTIQLDGGIEAVYKILPKESGAKVLYVIDVHPLTTAAFDRTIKHVYEEAAQDMDLMIFTGKLPFKPTKLVRLPRSLFKRYVSHAYLCGRILDHGLVDDRIFNIDNWNVNFSNNDVP